MDTNTHFWSQPPTRRRRPPPNPSPFLNPLFLILAIPIIVLILLFFLLPIFLSKTNQILRPNSVKKSWDSINVLLVLFAVLCGVFARRNEDALPSDDDRRASNAAVSVDSNLVNRSREFAPTWLNFPDRKEYNRMSTTVNVGGGRLRRSSSSYPDLRQETLWESDGNRSRFLDDFEVNFSRSPPRENFGSHTRRQHAAPPAREEPEMTIREIPVDKFEISSAVPSPTSPKSVSTPPPPPPPPPAAVLNRRRSVHSVSRKEHGRRRRNEGEINEELRRAPPPSPPPPPPEPHPEPKLQKHELIPRKKGGATKDFATAIVSLYKTSQRKRKKRTKSRDIYDTAPQNSSSPSVNEPRSIPPPPPPPPPPPSKVLQNLFRKSSKSKRVHSVPTTTAHPPPPPPPPPPNSIFNNIFKSGSKSKRHERTSTATPRPPPPPPPPPSSILNSIFKNDSNSRRFKNSNPLPSPPTEAPRPRQFTTGRPPKPTKPATQYYEEETNTNIAPASPLIPLPPPPPPPPFRMPDLKGDLVGIQGSVDVEDVEVMSVKSEGGASCPSPDVNAKADTFIARLRGEWRMERMNSMKY